MNDKEYTVIINGTPKPVSEKELNFAQVVELVYGHPPEGGNIVYSITFERGEGNKQEGILKTGETLKIKEGMLINATRADKS